MKTTNLPENGKDAVKIFDEWSRLNGYDVPRHELSRIIDYLKDEVDIRAGRVEGMMSEAEKSGSADKYLLHKINNELSELTGSIGGLLLSCNIMPSDAHCRALTEGEDAVKKHNSMTEAQKRGELAFEYREKLKLAKMYNNGYDDYIKSLEDKIRELIE